MVDLSHPIGRVTYPGIAPPELRTVVSRAESAARLAPGVSFEIESLTLVGNTGTYIDSPFHYHADKADIADLPLDRIVDVPVVVVYAEGTTSVGRGDSATLVGFAARPCSCIPAGPGTGVSPGTRIWTARTWPAMRWAP